MVAAVALALEYAADPHPENRSSAILAEVTSIIILDPGMGVFTVNSEQIYCVMGAHF